jgi:hypothetical protein
MCGELLPAKLLRILLGALDWYGENKLVGTILQRSDHSELSPRDWNEVRHESKIHLMCWST